MTRVIKFKDAISEGLCEAMEADPSIFVAGISVDYPSGIFGTTTEALRRFGHTRVFDVPAMENALTGIAIGAAAMGKRPVIVHPRADFMFLAFDQLINLAAKWSYMYGGNAGPMPVVTRAVIGRGWGQGATHSQSIQSVLAHFPGLSVGMPATVYDAKNMLKAALTMDGPVVLLEHRSLFEMEQEVDDDAFVEWNGEGSSVERVGSDVTIVATSFMVPEALKAASVLSKNGIAADVINLRWMRPLDEGTIRRSVWKTGRLVVADTSWGAYGVASEIAALVAEKEFEALKAPVERVTLPDCPAPVAHSLEKEFYPGPQQIIDVVCRTLGRETIPFDQASKQPAFLGPY